jgi:pimeloyl-ACP methyl ester carboxylesterase
VVVTVRTELCDLSASDGETLHGLLFTPGDSGRASDVAFVLVHGVAMNFYTGPLPVVGQLVAEQGYSALSMNTRGHDWICRASTGTGFGGAAFEAMEDCLLDLDGALGWLGERGYRRFVLFGHSLGGVKVLYYQGHRRRRDVSGVVSCSTPKHFYSHRAGEQADFAGHIAEAEALVAAARGDELLRAPAGSGMGLFSARTYVNKYGREERTDVRPHAGRLGCPLLATAGSREPAFVAHARELVAAAGPEGGACVVVEGAEHFYRGHTDVLASEVLRWLERAIASAR